MNDAWSISCTDVPDGQALMICDADMSNCKPVPAQFNYDRYCYPLNYASEYDSTEHLDTLGWIVTVFCTWSGFFFLFVGIFWVINFPEKLTKKWKAMRAQPPQEASGAELPSTV